MGMHEMFLQLKSESQPPPEIVPSSSGFSQSSLFRCSSDETGWGSLQLPPLQPAGATIVYGHQLSNHGFWQAYFTHEVDAGEGATSGNTQSHINPVSSVFHQVTQERIFGCEQKEDDCLKHSWG